MRHRFCLGMTGFILVGLTISWLDAKGEAPKSFMSMPLLFSDDFEPGKAEEWEATDPKAWQVVKQGENHVFSQFKQSDYKTPVRSPFNRAVRKGVVVGDFVLEARVQSTAREYGHRDLCLFFGYQDPSHFYYVHFGRQADLHAHSIFIVNNADRVSIAKTRTNGTPWDDNYHTVRIVHKVSTGAIEVFFDDMTKPIMTAEDKTFAWGQVGIGSFDDTGNFDDVRLWGVKAEPKKSNSSANSGEDAFLAEWERDSEKDLDDWDPKSESTLTPLEYIRNPRMDITGEWIVSWGYHCGSSLTVKRLGLGYYKVVFQTSRLRRLARIGRFIDGVLLLDRPVREDIGYTYTKLYAVRVEEQDYLVPSPMVGLHLWSKNRDLLGFYCLYHRGRSDLSMEKSNIRFHLMPSAKADSSMLGGLLKGGL